MKWAPGITQALFFRESEDILEPDWSPTDFIPTTWPGSRLLHIYLDDGTTSIHDVVDTLGITLVNFTESKGAEEMMQESADALNIPLRIVNLASEVHAKKICEKLHLLIRPDLVVAWRSNHLPSDRAKVRHLLSKVTGRLVG